MRAGTRRARGHRHPGGTRSPGGARLRSQPGPVDPARGRRRTCRWPRRAWLATWRSHPSARSTSASTPNRWAQILVANDRARSCTPPGMRSPVRARHGVAGRRHSGPRSDPRRRTRRSPATSRAPGSSTTGIGMDPGALTVALALAARRPRRLDPPPPPRARARGARRRGHRRRDRRRRDRGRHHDRGGGAVVARRCSNPPACACPSRARGGGSCGCSPTPDLLTHLIESPGPHAALRGRSRRRRPTAAEVATDGIPASAIGAILHPHRDGRTVLVGLVPSDLAHARTAPRPTSSARLLAAAIALVPSLGRRERVVVVVGAAAALTRRAPVRRRRCARGSSSRRVTDPRA